MSTPAPPTDSDLNAQPFLERPLSRLLGTKSATPLAKLGLHTAHDLLHHHPRRYAEPGRLTDVTGLTEGEHVTVMAQVLSATTRTMRSRAGALFTVTVTDGNHPLTLAFFAKRAGALRIHEDKLRPGRVALFTGTVRDYRGERQLTHPDYIIIGEDAHDKAQALDEAARPIPIYPASASAPTWRIERAVATVLGQLRPEDLTDPLPTELRQRQHLLSAYDAMTKIHQPRTDTDWHSARHRFRVEEAFVIQCALVQRRHHNAHLQATPRTPHTGGLLDAFDARLPFTLTDGQRTVGTDIAADLTKAHPMQRLLQGDVGSGKTVIALRAMLQVIDAGGQAVLLAPTEVLATQHLATIRELLGPLASAGMLGATDNATSVVLLTGSLPTAQRRQALLDAASGAAGIIVGTHAVLSDNVSFADLGLVVVDEQHRFGVEQRDALRTRANTIPHMLVMTATPIPRTVAMTVFGDLDISTLNDMPAGRAGITTHVVPSTNDTWMNRVWARIREEIDAGRQAYVVCPRISDTTPEEQPTPQPTTDTLLDIPETTTTRTLTSVEETAQKLRDMPLFADIAIATLHGAMNATDKDHAMTTFAQHTTPILVATTVIEVGVNVPTASTMVILDADRFGISQLHQLRGRVGRGTDPGICLLVAPPDPQSLAHQRLTAVASTTDGFALAAMDLELRSEGDVLGAAQSGRASSLRHVRVIKDHDLILQARHDAQELIAQDPQLQGYPHLRDAINDYVGAEREEYLDRA
ncbi:ATP-dependent DNA helicase RecG [Jonesia quinghaiensis]|uniref:ATP-dependent DNA helicase RecG n=1 Tax=Jonesia quinghaiensis TaxID=262806 RepID=UPI000686B4A4|nr:ATP-dependent DNA helicase RecG [Jonesia quinghaiensis]